MGIFESFARKYFEAGYSVIPVQGKNQPLIKSHGELGKNGVTKESLEEFIEKYGSANIALLPGEASGVVAFDFDYSEPNYREFELIIKEIIPPSPVQKFGKKGWTAFYKFNPNITTRNYGYKKPGKDRNGKDIESNHIAWEYLSTGRYTIMPPSIHPDTGSPYIWLTEDTLENIEANDLPMISAYDFAELQRQSDIFFGKNKETTGRNTSIWRYAYKIAPQCSSKEEWVNKIVSYDLKKNGENSWFNDPKERKNKSKEKFIQTMTESWLKSIKKAKKQYENVDFYFGISADQIDEELFYPKDIEKIEKLFPGFKEGFFWEKPSSKNDGESILVPLDKPLAKYLKQVEGLKIFHGGYVKIHNGVYYESLEHNQLKQLIIDRVSDVASVNHIDKFYKRIIMEAQIRGPFPDTPVGKINLKNCVLDVLSGETFAHSKDFFFSQALDISYDKNAKCDLWKSTLDDILSGDQELISLIKHLFGYILIGGFPFLHKAFVFYGAGRNGKGVVVNILKALLGSQSYSCVSLDNISRPFAAVRMDKMLANISEETPSEVNSEILKTIVGGGELQVAQKGKEEYLMKCNARMVFCCNDFPYFKDKNFSMTDRLVVIPFNKTYVEGKNRDPFLYDKLLPELPGILNWACEGAKEVLQSKMIKQPVSSIKVKEEYRMETDPVYAWFKECVEIVKADPSNEKSVEYFYSEFIIWANINGHKNPSKNPFSKRLLRIVRELSDSEISETKLFYSDQGWTEDGKRAKPRRFRGYDILKLSKTM